LTLIAGFGGDETRQNLEFDTAEMRDREWLSFVEKNKNKKQKQKKM
jgi:hypothetical protein